MIKIKALDTVFFRDNKPFNKSQENWGDCIFPPMPSVIYGALRSAYLVNNIDIIKNNKLDSKLDKSANLKIKAIYYGIHKKWLKNDKIYLPLPLDLVKEKDNKNKKATLLNITKVNDVICNVSTEYVLSSNNKVENIEDGIISENNFKNYLLGNTDILYCTLDDHIKMEPKIGIARDKTKITKDEMLYSINMIRPINLMYYVDYEGISLPKKGYLKLGGQNKPSYYSHDNKIINFIDSFFDENNICSYINDKYFKLYLLTPGLFSNGWLPKIIDEKTKILNKGKVKAKLITAAIGKPKYISGFDLKEKKPKAILKAVPEGSVYYFELLEGNFNDVLNEFYLNSICDMGDSYINRGFGITLVGRVNL